MSLTSSKIKSLTSNVKSSVSGAPRQNRTGTPKRERDFESCHYSMISKATLDFGAYLPALYTAGRRKSLTPNFKTITPHRPYDKLDELIAWASSCIRR